MESPNKCRVKSGFTLVELSIVMIIIGLLIGGIFGGMKLIDNANVQKTIQDLKSIEGAGITFKDIYRAIPGDIRNPNTRLPNCTTAPCATGGDGDRRISPTHSSGTLWSDAITDTMERFTFWHHLQAANLIGMDFHNTIDMTFGEGQPSSPLGSGYRITEFTGTAGGCPTQVNNAILLVTAAPTLAYASSDWDTIPCPLLNSIDRKIDDGIPTGGNFLGHHCATSNDCVGVYNNNTTGHIFFDLKGF